MKKLAIVTATRAEYGLLSRLIRMFKTSDKIDTQLIATGSHLSKEYGMTIQEIEKDGIIVDKRIDILSNNNSDLQKLFLVYFYFVYFVLPKIKSVTKRSRVTHQKILFSGSPGGAAV